jgi:hypothetical protein
MNDDVDLSIESQRHSPIELHDCRSVVTKVNEIELRIDISDRIRRDNEDETIGRCRRASEVYLNGHVVFLSN